jgi:CO dehydrogenase maturation factor
MTAGADAFASGLFTRFDMTIIVVEPTIKSLDVYFQYKKYAQKFGVAIKVVGNKIFDERDEAFLLAHIEKGDYLGGLVFSHDIKEVERGGELTVNIFKNSNIEFLCRKIKEILDDQKRIGINIIVTCSIFIKKMENHGQMLHWVLMWLCK